MPRNYIRKGEKKERIKEENSAGAGGTSRGTNSTRGRRKPRASADLDVRTIVASNPFDDDDHSQLQQQHLHHQQHQQQHLHHQHHHHHHQKHQPQHQQHPQMHAQHQPHLHQPLQHPIPHQVPPPPPPGQHPHQHHSPAPMGLQSPYGQPMQPNAYPPPPQQQQQQLVGGMNQHGLRMHPQPPHLQSGPPPPHQHLVEQSPMQPSLVGTPTPPPPRGHPMYGFQGANSGYQVVSPPPQQHPPHQHTPPVPPQQAPPPNQQQQQPPAQQQQQQQPMMHQMEAGQPPIAPYQPAAQAPLMVYCGECRQAIYPNEPRIVCRAGCDFYYHRHCSGLTELACELLLRETNAEWACNRCINSNRQIPVVRVHNQQPDCRLPVW